VRRRCAGHPAPPCAPSGGPRLDAVASLTPGGSGASLFGGGAFLPLRGRGGGGVQPAHLTSLPAFGRPRRSPLASLAPGGAAPASPFGGGVPSHPRRRTRDRCLRRTTGSALRRPGAAGVSALLRGALVVGPLLRFGSAPTIASGGRRRACGVSPAGRRPSAPGRSRVRSLDRRPPAARRARAQARASGPRAPARRSSCPRPRRFSSLGAVPPASA
jgi:hypothetical protein